MNLTTRQKRLVESKRDEYKMLVQLVLDTLTDQEPGKGFIADRLSWHAEDLAYNDTLCKYWQHLLDMANDEESTATLESVHEYYMIALRQGGIGQGGSNSSRLVQEAKGRALQTFLNDLDGAHFGIGLMHLSD